MNKIVRFIGDGMAHGSYKGRCYDYNIESKKLFYVTMFGGLVTKQEDEYKQELQDYLDAYFTDVDMYSII